jgi:hypothetical protein
VSDEFYVAAFPSGAEKQRVSAGGGMHPVWRGDSRELLYLAPDKKLMAADIDPDTLRAATPHPLFQTKIMGMARNHYTVSADGQRFLIYSPVSDAAISDHGGLELGCAAALNARPSGEKRQIHYWPAPRCTRRVLSRSGSRLWLTGEVQSGFRRRV